MCNRYALDSLDEISDLYSLRAIGSFGYGTVFPRQPAPTLLADGEARLMQFGLATKPGPPFNNARIENPNKWPWLKLIETQRCVVPITRFHEPCYWGPAEGKQVWFERPDRRLLFVAGIYQDDGMALWLRPALPFVMEHGHRRSPLLIRPDALGEWLDPTPRSTDDALDLLRDIADNPELICTVESEMRPGWRNRQQAHIKKRDEQIVASREVRHAAGF